jgi:hypothetical protein
MFPTDLEEAIYLVESGDHDQALIILANLARQNPDDLAVWSWLRRCVRTDRQREWCNEQIYRIQRKTSATAITHKPVMPVFRRGMPTHTGLPAREWQKPQTLTAIGGGVALLLLLLLAGWWIANRSGWFTGSENLLDTSQTAMPGVMAGTGGKLDPNASSMAASDQLIAYLPDIFVPFPTPTPDPETLQPTAIPDLRPNPKKWKSWPVTPFVSQNALDIWHQGVKSGNDPGAFSVLGDCHSVPGVLFGRFAAEDLQSTPEYKSFRKTLRYFRGSWGREFITVANGMSVASAFNPRWARHPSCRSGETPLECEFRLHNPNLLIISLGTNWGTRSPDEFEEYLRQIVDFAIKRHVLPVIATKGDPAGPENPLNERMVRVAYDYDIPLWNFWVAIQDLPNQGLKPRDRGGVYLSTEAWTVKRETGLLTLDAIRKTVSGE